MTTERAAGSFRDPSGFVFWRDGAIYRQVNRIYKDHYDHLMASGLYEHLVAEGLLIPHEEVTDAPELSADGAYKVIRPEMVPFISYPYEWCFSQLKNAAITTLAVQKAALNYGMTLKDASAYNIQFYKGRPVFIDTLSFEKYVEGAPWTPYKQFCQHFYGVLAMMSYVDIRLQRQIQCFIDGIPLDLAAAVLPGKTKFVAPLFMHIHLHAKSMARYADRPIKSTEFQRKMSKTALLGLFDSLEGGIKRLKWEAEGTEWADYYSDDSYTTDGLAHKQRLLEEMLRAVSPKTVWDLGANTGFHSRLAAGVGAETIAFDVDPAAVEKGYLQMIQHKETNILPLLFDLTNPSPSIGWENNERMSLIDRGPVDLAMALALVHHLAISNNVPLPSIAELFSRICDRLIIEFVPKSDHKVQKLLATRQDIFPDYTQEGFMRAFETLFTIERSARIQDSDRVLYLMQLRQARSDQDKGQFFL
ncbi:MAG: SAM-dependent methyltransferase [Armatimonadetes bacterium]|nr:SAM-dependent methyltransferase [Armatimonadota bacterium]